MRRIRAKPTCPGITVIVTDSLGTTQTVVTNATGDYAASVPVGTTTVKIDETTLPPGSVRTAGSDPATVTVPGGGTVATAAVGYQQRGSVSGRVFNDVNGNGVQDPGEPGFANVSVTVTDPHGSVRTLATDTNGDYATSVPIGTSTASVVANTLPPGSVLTTANETQNPVVNAGLQTKTNPVGYQQQGRISGHVYNDDNGNGVQDPGELDLPNIAVVVTDSLGTTRTAVTDSNGRLFCHGAGWPGRRENRRNDASSGQCAHGGQRSRLC